MSAFLARSIEAKADSGVVESRWRNIADAPREQHVLLLLANRSAVVGRYDRGRGGWFVHLPGLANPISIEPTSWARIPPIPPR